MAKSSKKSGEKLSPKEDSEVKVNPKSKKHLYEDEDDDDDMDDEPIIKKGAKPAASKSK